MRVAVVGLGYVGIPVAAVLASAGHRVSGIDIDPAKVRAVASGHNPLRGREPGLGELLAAGVRQGRLEATEDYGALGEAEAVIVAVETPVDPKTHAPRYAPLESALDGIGRHMGPKPLVSIESTLSPGTMASAVRLALEARGAKAGKDFHLVHCPERLTAGKLLLNLTTLDRVLGSEEPEASERAVRLYADITKGRVHTTDWVTAEVVKTAENAYWDLQIAFANELALLCEPVGVDAHRARELINTCPGRSVLFPGAGVGGPCIPKDPWLLVQAAPTRSQLIPAARRVNDSMPLHMADLVDEGLRRARRALKGSKVVILGLSYREGTEDSRNSPTIPLAEELGRRGAKVSVHDPLAPPVQGISPERDLRAAAEGADAIALVTAHEEYRSLDLRALGKVMRTRVLVDGRNTYRQEDAAAAGFIYLGLGKPLG